MGTYFPGDVLLARIRLHEGGDLKSRPVIVIRADQDALQVSPISSKPPSDAPFVPLAPGDFGQGGLDICDESYILVSLLFPIRPGEVIGKKGRVVSGVLESISQLRGR